LLETRNLNGSQQARNQKKNASTAGELAGSSQPIAAEEFLAIESQP
jgi:hypothetical protein